MSMIFPAMFAQYNQCPLCDYDGLRLHRQEDAIKHDLWHPNMSKTLDWMQCKKCDHVFTKNFWTKQGLKLLFQKTHPFQLPLNRYEEKRYHAGHTIELIEQAKGFSISNKWLDVGIGDCAMLLTIKEFGHEAIGLEPRIINHAELSAAFDVQIEYSSFEDYTSDDFAVIIMADVLEHMPYPKQALKKAYNMLTQRGILFISCPNMSSPLWKIMDIAAQNAYWYEIEHHHNFSSERLQKLLLECNFRPIHYRINPRYKAGMEILARAI